MAEWPLVRGEAEGLLGTGDRPADLWGPSKPQILGQGPRRGTLLCQHICYNPSTLSSQALVTDRQAVSQRGLEWGSETGRLCLFFAPRGRIPLHFPAVHVETGR